jgi:hypothetical protein
MIIIVKYGYEKTGYINSEGNRVLGLDNYCSRLKWGYCLGHILKACT